MACSMSVSSPHVHKVVIGTYVVVHPISSSIFDILAIFNDGAQRPPLKHSWLKSIIRSGIRNPVTLMIPEPTFRFFKDDSYLQRDYFVAVTSLNISYATI